MDIKIEGIYKPDLSTSREQPCFEAKVPAGFPSPAADYEEGRMQWGALRYCGSAIGFMALCCFCVSVTFILPWGWIHRSTSFHSSLTVINSFPGTKDDRAAYAL